MVTPLDIGLLQRFDVIFPFIFILAIVYAVLAGTEIFKERQAFAFILAFVLALMTLLSSVAVKTINLMAPWLVLLVVFAIFIIIAYTAFGVKQETIMNVLTKGEYRTTFAWWVLALMIIIGVGSLSSVISEEVGFVELPEGEAPEGVPREVEQVGFWATLFHPKVLGLALILLIGLFTVQKLAAKD